MASAARRLDTNAPGDLYVDDSCIDCGTCRWMAPAVYDQAAGYSRVHRQPDDAGAWDRALDALVACPTASIGVQGRHPVKAAADRFPRPWAAGPGWDVLHCGFHSQDSFGATSWLLRQDAGPSVLIDSPRYVRGLADRIEALGGVDLIFLTHRDDVADHARWADRFGAPRIIHEGDRRAVPGAERVITGLEPVEIAPGLRVLPTPGHTRGSACLHTGDVLFTGDTLAWSPRLGHVHAFRGACWYSWSELADSVRRLQGLSFQWLLPGHGWPCHYPREEMRSQLQRCLAWMVT